MKLSFVAASVLSSKAEATFFTEVNEDAKTISPDMAARPPYERGFLKNFELRNDMYFYDLCLLIVIVILGCIFARAVTINGRNGYIVNNNPLASVLSLSASILVVAALGLAFYVTHWYWPLVIFLVGTAISGFGVNAQIAKIVFPFQTIFSIVLVILSAIFFYRIYN